MQNAVIVTVRQVQDGGVEGVVDAPLEKHLQTSQDFLITENMYAECLLGFTLCCMQSSLGMSDTVKAILGPDIWQLSWSCIIHSRP